MGRQNIVFLYGRVCKAPVISKIKETNEYNYGMVYLDAVRGYREIDDGVRFVKHDHPLIMSREKEIVDKMLEWKENTIVFVKGAITTTRMAKTSFCPDCTDEDGKPTRNESTGNLVYITPIYVEKVRDYDNKQQAIEDVIRNREISNQIYVLGTVLKDPKIITTKQGIQFSQYPIAINRKFTIRTDDPSIRTDWPIVKSYGEQARDDKSYLKYQAEVIIDGFLQARTITRKQKCKCCGKIYEWKDHAMELVPYEVEYVSGFKTTEEAEAEYNCKVDEYKQMLFDTAYKDDLDEDLKSDDTGM